jgi:type VI protein secretion system component VasF
MRLKMEWQIRYVLCHPLNRPVGRQITATRTSKQPSAKKEDNLDTMFIGAFLSGAVIVLTVAVLWLGFQLSRIRADLRKVLRPTMSEWLARFSGQIQANLALLGGAQGRELLVDFTLSEAALLSFVEQVEREVEAKINQEQLRQQLAKDDRSVFQRAKDYLSRNKGKIAEKVFGKLNDLVKGVIPGLR